MALRGFLSTYVASATYIAVVDSSNDSYYEGRAGQIKHDDNYYDIADARVVEVFVDKQFPDTLVICVDTVNWI